jgi:hypothetical protein
VWIIGSTQGGEQQRWVSKMRRKVEDTDDELHEEEKKVMTHLGIPCDQVVKEENEWEDGIT